MKLRLVFIFLFLFIGLYAFAEDDEPETDNEDETILLQEEKDNGIKPKKFILRASASPKKEQCRAKIKAKKHLDKQKQIFEKQVQDELERLHKEEDVLDYHS